MFETYLLSLTSALYLLRGMLEIRDIGWRPEVTATAVVGVGLLPVLAALVPCRTIWVHWLILALCMVGFAINGILLVKFWRGLTRISAVTIAIMTAYALVVGALV